jgi:hypothetical protein
MVEKLKGYGIEDAHYELQDTRVEARLSQAYNDEAIQEGDRLQSLPTAWGGCRAKLVWLGDSAVDTYEKRKEEIGGNIVMVSSANPLGMTRSLHRSEKFMRSVLAGAKGWIFMNQYPAYGPQTGGISPIIPSISVSYEDGMYLVRTLEREGEVNLKIKTGDKNIGDDLQRHRRHPRHKQE